MKKQITKRAGLFWLKLTVLVFAFLLVSGQGWGQVTIPHLDPINYTVGQGLQTQTGWTSLNSGDALLIASGNLTYTGLPTSTGEKVTFDGAGIDAAKLFTQQTSGTVYYSFLLNITSLGSLNTTGGYFTGFNEGTGTNFGGTVWTKKDAGGTGYNIGVNPRTTAANTAWVSGVQPINSTLLVVISYQIVSSTGNDIVKIWINPTPGASEPTANATATNTGTDLANLNRILIRQDATTTTPFIEMDELRIGTTWADVTPSGGSTAPLVTTTSVSGIGTTSATFNGNITSDGGASISDRGFCYKTSTGVSIIDNPTSEGGTSTGTYSKSMTLSAATNYFYKAYATNSVGTTLSNTEINFWTFATEPSVHSTTFSNSVISQTQIDVSFDALSSISNASGYLILQKSGSTPTGLPSDGIAYSVGNTFGDATVAAIVTNTSSTLANITGLTAGTHYYFTIIPYNSGANNATYNYKTDGTIPTTNGTTQAPLDATSEISGPVLGSQPNPTLLSSLVTTDVGAVRVFDMDAYDYGTDGQPTKITQLTIKAGTNNTANWANTIQGVKLSLNGGTSFVTMGVPTISASSIVIPIVSGNLNIADADAETISLYVYLKSSGLTDNQVLEFKVDATASSHGFTADGTGSTFLATFASAPVSNQILIDVVATKLNFVQQPTNVGTSQNITPAVTVSANDANGNRDLDYVTNVSITASGSTLTGSPVSIPAISGLATFSTLSLTVAATGVTLNAFSGAITGETSTSFNVILLPIAGEIVINQMSGDYAGASDEYVELLNKTNKTFDLSKLKLEYRAAGTGNIGGAGGNLTGTLGPYEYWLLSPNATITVGQTSSLSRDGSITAGFAAIAGQMAIRIIDAPNTIIDGLAYGSVAVNVLGEGSTASAPPNDGGLTRTPDGYDTGENSTDFTTVSNANILLHNHLSLPTAYAITGSGSYCQGSGGLPVGLIGSQLGYSYELWKDASATGNIVIGTGASLSFGNQTAGAYTVKATNTGGTSDMTGSAVITVNALPTITLDATSVNVASGVTSAALTYSGTAESPVSYSIDYDATANGVGFVDVNNALFSAGQITLSVPAGAAPTTYTANLIVKNGNGCVSASYPFTLTVTGFNFTTAQDIGTTLLLTWPQTIGASSYAIYYRLEGTQPWTAVSMQGLNYTRISNLIPEKTYDCRIMAYNSAGQLMSNSVPGTFLTGKVEYGQTQDIGTTLLLNWTDFSPWASSYSVSYRKIGSPAWLSRSSYVNEVKLSNLTANSAYEIRILVYKNGSLWGTSRLDTITTGKVSFSNSQDIGTTLLLTWTPFTGNSASSYAIQYRPLNGVWQGSPLYANPGKLFGLEPETSYEVRELVYIGSTLWGTSQTDTITTGKVDFTLIADNGTSMEIGWSDFSPWAGNYTLQYSRLAANNWVNSANTTNTSSIISPLLTNTDYYVRLNVFIGTTLWGSSKEYHFVRTVKNSFAEISEQSGLSVYPNPFVEQINLEISTLSASTVNWIIYDMTGREVLSGNESVASGNNTLAIDATSLPQGVYMLNTMLNDESKSFRIVKQ